MDDSSSNIDQRLLTAYRNTIYQVLKPSISIQIGVPNPILDAFLQSNNATTWAFITAWNPQSQLLSTKENNQRQQELIKMLENAGYSYFFGKGIGENDDWQPEESLLILNISKTSVIQIGKHFEQNAVVFGSKGELPELVLTAN